MSLIFAFIAPGELESRHDPVRVLKISLDRARLLSDLRYDPNSTYFWALRAVESVERPPIDITNDMTDQPEAVCVCTLRAT